MKKTVSTTYADIFKDIKSYSVEEVFAAGGATAFGRKHGKNNQKLIDDLKSLPPIEPFSDEEWADLLDQLARDK